MSEPALAGARIATGTGHPAWRRLALGGAGGMFVGMGLGRFSYTAMVPALIVEGGLDGIAAGRIGMANLVGFMAGAALSASLAKRVSRATILRGAVLVAVAALFGSAAPLGLSWLALCRGVLGVATGLIMVLSLALIAETAPDDQRPLAAGFMFVGVGLGILASGALVPLLLGHGLIAAWTGLAAAGLIGAGLAFWGWSGAPDAPAVAMASPVGSGRLRAGGGGLMTSKRLALLLVAHGLFSLGIVPHSLYWVDFIVRGEGHGIAAGGLHWGVVGVFAILGPLLTAGLARLAGTGPALVIAFAALGLGLGAPGLWPATLVLVASSVLFGAQPGLSSLMAARARDLGPPAGIAGVMRAMILANSLGSVSGGLLVPWLYGELGSHAPLFLLGGAAMLMAAVAALPGAGGSPAPHELPGGR